MDKSAFFWFGLTLLCIVTQGFYSMLEIACISFNRVRLEYYVSQGVKRAHWLQYLLQKPSRLFGTVMLGVNIALQVGSQSSREFYVALNLNPDIATLTQVFFVIIVAELAPLFAGHRYAEHVVMLGIPIVYATHLILSPVIWLIGLMSRGVDILFGNRDKTHDIFVTREELQKVLESHEEEVAEGEEFNLLVSGIFSLRNQTAGSMMLPLEKVELLPSNATILQFKHKITHIPKAFIPLYHKQPSHIIALAFPRDLVRIADNKLVRDYSRPPWFITQETPLLQILKQFRSNNQSGAVVLDTKGSAIGILMLDTLIEGIFGPLRTSEGKRVSPSFFIERTFPGNTKISDFNREYGTAIASEEEETLAQLMVTLLDHHPEQGESIALGGLEFTVEEASLMGIKTISVKTLET